MSSNRKDWLRYQTIYPLGEYAQLISEITYLYVGSNSIQPIQYIRVIKYFNQTTMIIINFKKNETGENIQHLLFKKHTYLALPSNFAYLSDKTPHEEKIFLMNALLASLEMPTQEKIAILIDAHLTDPPPLSTTHQALIKAYLSDFLDTIEEVAKNKNNHYLLKDLLHYLHPQTLYIPLEIEIDYKLSGLWSYFTEVKQILEHPCPQNGSESYGDYDPINNNYHAFLIKRDEVEYYELPDTNQKPTNHIRQTNQQVTLRKDILFSDYENDGDIYAQEPNGLLNLKSRNNTDSTLLHKETVDHYIYQVLQNTLEKFIELGDEPQHSWQESVSLDFGDGVKLQKTTDAAYQLYYEENFQTLYEFKQVCAWLIDYKDNYINNAPTPHYHKNRNETEENKQEIDRIKLSYSEKLSNQIEELERFLTMAVMHGYNRWIDQIVKLQNSLKGHINIDISHITYLGQSLLMHALPYPSLTLPLLILYGHRAKKVLIQRNPQGVSALMLVNKYYEKDTPLHQTLTQLCQVDAELYFNINKLMLHKSFFTCNWKLMVFKHYGMDVRGLPYYPLDAWKDYYSRAQDELSKFNDALLYLLEHNLSMNKKTEENLKNSLLLAAVRGYDAWFKALYRYAPQVLIMLNNKYQFLTAMNEGAGYREHTRYFLQKLKTCSNTEESSAKKSVGFTNAT